MLSKYHSNQSINIARLTGSGLNDITTSGQEDLIRLSTSDIISDMIHNIVPDNIIRVTIQTVGVQVTER